MFRISGPGMMVLVIAFVVAVIFAANQNDVVGWVVAVIAAFWLALAASWCSASRRPPRRPAPS